MDPKSYQKAEEAQRVLRSYIKGAEVKSVGIVPLNMQYGLKVIIKEKVDNLPKTVLGVPIQYIVANQGGYMPPKDKPQPIRRKK